MNSILENYYNSRHKKFFPISAFVFLLLTLGYIGLEIYFNFTLIHQMSVESSKDTLDKVETFGKILSGIGIGLILTKGCIDTRYDGSWILSVFIGYSLAGILISFILQTAIIKGVVYFGSDQNKGKALLITQLNNTITPFFNHSDSSSKKIDLTAKEYFIASQECRDNTKGIQVDGKLNKVIFPYQTLSLSFEEERYKKIVKKHQECLINKTIIKKLPAFHLDENILSKSEIKNNLYDKYKEMNKQFNSEADKFNQAKNNRFHNGSKAYKIPKRLQKEWIKRSKELFGENSNVFPNMTKSEFLKHKDVISKVNTLPSRESLKVEYEENKVKVYNDSMENVFSAYNAHRQFIDEVRVKNDYVLEEVNAKDSKLADEAYKSIVMPIVVLFFSIFFLMLNVLSLFTFFVSRIEYRFSRRLIFTKLSQYIVFGVMISLVCLPIFSKKQTVEHANSFTKVVFYYEKMLIDLYEKKDIQLLKKSLKNDKDS